MVLVSGLSTGRVDMRHLRTLSSGSVELISSLLGTELLGTELLETELLGTESKPSV